MNKFANALTEELKDVEFIDLGVSTTKKEKERQYDELIIKTGIAIRTDSKKITVLESKEDTIKDYRLERTCLASKDKTAYLDIVYHKEGISENTLTMYERKPEGVYMLETYYDNKNSKMGISIKFFSNEEYSERRSRGCEFVGIKDNHYKTGDIFQDIVLDPQLVYAGFLDGIIQLDTEVDSDEESYLKFLKHIYNDGILSCLKEPKAKKLED